LSPVEEGPDKRIVAMSSLLAEQADRSGRTIMETPDVATNRADRDDNQGAFGSESARVNDR